MNPVLKAVETALEAAIGAPTTVQTARLLGRKTRMARHMGRSASALDVVTKGFGLALEPRITRTTIIVDTSRERDDAVEDALHQARSIINVIGRRRGMAATLGHERPLSRDEFLCTSRLRVDVDAGRMLLEALGSDEAVRAWTRDRLSDAYDGRIGRGARVIGTRLTFDLDLGETIRLGSNEETDASWDGCAVIVTTNREATAREAAEEAERILASRGMSHRDILTSDVHPAAAVRSAMRDRDATYTPHPHRRGRERWRFELDRRLVGFDQAFG